MILAKHVSELADALDIDVVKMRKGSDRGGASGPKSYGYRRRIVTYGVNNQQDYFIALHEIGHIANEPQAPQILLREANAWKWALDNAIVEPSLLTKAKIAEWLGSYVSPAAEVPPEGHVYHTIIGWARLNPNLPSKPAAGVRKRRLP